MSRASLLAGALALLLGGLAVAGAQAQPDAKRLLRGQVLDEDGKLVENAIVHLKNLTTREQLSVVTDKEGRYRFNDVDKKNDYEIFAEWREQKSRTRKVSQFDTRAVVTINLPLEPLKQPAAKEGQKEEKQD